MSAAARVAACALAAAAQLASAPTAAQADSALHSVAVRVNDRSADERNVAKRTGLARVLQRLSGRDDLLGREGVSAAFDDVDAYVASYHYRTRPDPAGSERAELALEYRIDAVAELLERAKVPVWSGSRPLILLLVALQDGDESRFVSEDDEDFVAQSLAYHLRRHGLPFSFPLFDLTDRGLLPLDAALRNETPAAQLFGRYRADSMLSGAVRRLDAGGWSCRMRYQIGLVNDAYAFDAASFDDCIARVADQVARRLFRMYTVSGPDSALSERIDVEGVFSFSDYVAVVRYLSRLSPVRQAQVLRVDGSTINVGLRVVGARGRDQLRALLANDNRLTPLPARRDGARLRERYGWRGG